MVCVGLCSLDAQVWVVDLMGCLFMAFCAVLRFFSDCPFVISLLFWITCLLVTTCTIKINKFSLKTENLKCIVIWIRISCCPVLCIYSWFFFHSGKYKRSYKSSLWNNLLTGKKTNTTPNQALTNLGFPVATGYLLPWKIYLYMVSACVFVNPFSQGFKDYPKFSHWNYVLLFYLVCVAATSTG